MSVERPQRGGPQIIPRPATATLGGPPPWSHQVGVRHVIELGLLEARLRDREVTVNEWGVEATTTDSAVLIAIDPTRPTPTVILTRRSRRMRSHRHEVAFPGGRREPDDSRLTDTALREAHEEIGLEPARARIVGMLDPFVTVGSASMVHPYVAYLDGGAGDLVANPDEVEEILRVSLDELLLDEVWREELWPIEGRVVPVTFFELYGDTVWGATANMLRQLLTIATDPVD